MASKWGAWQPHPIADVAGLLPAPLQEASPRPRVQGAVKSPNSSLPNRQTVALFLRSGKGRIRKGRGCFAGL